MAPAHPGGGIRARRIARALCAREPRRRAAGGPACSCWCVRSKSRRLGRTSATSAASARVHDLAIGPAARCASIERAANRADVGESCADFGAMCFDEGFDRAAPRVGPSCPPPRRSRCLRLRHRERSRSSCRLKRRGQCEHACSACLTDEPRTERRARLRLGRHDAPRLNGRQRLDAARRSQAALTATAHILVTRSGPALQPGPRRYTRSWIRDGAMMSAALLRMGHAREVREFIRWYAPHQRADGFVPCCVDRRGHRLAGRARQPRRTAGIDRRLSSIHRG